MTMPAPQTTPEQDEALPPPLLRRMVSNPFFPDEGTAPRVWQVGEQHPLKSNATVRRMFIVDGGIEIYAMETLPQGMFRGMRNFVPMHWVKVTSALWLSSRKN